MQVRIVDQLLHQFRTAEFRLIHLRIHEIDGVGIFFENSGTFDVTESGIEIYGLIESLVFAVFTAILQHEEMDLAVLRAVINQDAGQGVQRLLLIGTHREVGIEFVHASHQLAGKIDTRHGMNGIILVL